jgi:glutathione S-transferase
VYWLHFAEGSLMSLMLIALVLSRVPEAKESPVNTRILDRVKQMLAFVDAELGDGPWFAGAEFTAADVMMVFPFTTMRRFLDYDLAPYANIVAYMGRVEARPAYRRAMASATRRS